VSEFGFLPLTSLRARIRTSCERKFEEAANGVEYRRVERVAGKFTRSFFLPQTVKSDGIKVTYRDGILEIHVPKAEEAKPKQIAITVNESLQRTLSFEEGSFIAFPLRVFSPRTGVTQKNSTEKKKAPDRSGAFVVSCD
jgi:HSP20 family protein